jgi:hypothetical protein
LKWKAPVCGFVIDINRLLQRLCDADIDFVIVDRVRAASIQVELFDRSCRVISLDDLIQAKEALGREKDLLTAKELRAAREKQK